MDDILKYDKVSEPLKAEKAQLWKTAIGLQAVDGLKTSGKFTLSERVTPEQQQYLPFYT